MTFTLHENAYRAGYKMKVFKTVDSTNNLAIEYAKNSDDSLLWIIAEKQLEGRGRNGHLWESPFGNLATSLLLVDKFNFENIASLGFVAGVSFLEACSEMIADLEVSYLTFHLKWPNDILLQYEKLGGILLEVIPLKNSGLFAVIIGIGANVIKIPEKITTTYHVTSLHKNGIIKSSSDLFYLLSKHWMINYALWDHGKGIKKIRDKWIKFATGLGSLVSVKRYGSALSGIFETINNRCCLILRQRNGQLINISAGEVFFENVSSVYTRENGKK